MFDHNTNPKTPNHAGRHESLLSQHDVECAAQAFCTRTSDLLDRFPALQEAMQSSCEQMCEQLAEAGVPLQIAKNTALHTYGLVTVATLAVHRSVWNSMMPSEID